ncbi:hypothetical protein BDZ89DRAFT_33371 [Hymenopellis radicata]|nr:hypothetical protein BDZ89DRAFT_33371 [Hymenopellis radicata]
MSFILTSPASEETLHVLFGNKRLDGRCWQDLLTGPAPKSRFPTITAILNAVKAGVFALDLEAHFDVVSNVPGVVHISPTDDTSGWKAVEILHLPGHLLIGGSFFQEMLRDGLATPSPLTRRTNIEILVQGLVPPSVPSSSW